MKKQELIVTYKKKRIKLLVEKFNLLESAIGLMFSSKEKSGIILFDFKKERRIDIHSFFVFYDFLAIWLNKKNEVIQIKKVKPFIPYIGIKEKSYKLIEIPISTKYKKEIAFFLPSVVRNI